MGFILLFSSFYVILKIFFNEYIYLRSFIKILPHLILLLQMYSPFLLLQLIIGDIMLSISNGNIESKCYAFGIIAFILFHINYRTYMIDSLLEYHSFLPNLLILIVFIVMIVNIMLIIHPKYEHSSSSLLFIYAIVLIVNIYIHSEMNFRIHDQPMILFGISDAMTLMNHLYIKKYKYVSLFWNIISLSLYYNATNQLLFI